MYNIKSDEEFMSKSPTGCLSRLFIPQAFLRWGNKQFYMNIIGNVQFEKKNVWGLWLCDCVVWWNGYFREFIQWLFIREYLKTSGWLLPLSRLWCLIGLAESILEAGIDTLACRESLLRGNSPSFMMLSFSWKCRLDLCYTRYVLGEWNIVLYYEFIQAMIGCSQEFLMASSTNNDLIKRIRSTQ